jgi:hypothetical protein
VKDFFQTPGWWYNFYSFVFGFGGLLLGLVGLWLAYIQIAKTLNAAQAAKNAAEATSANLARLTTVINIERLSTFCREAMTLLAAERYLDAERPIHDLRVGLAQLRSATAGEPLGDTQWEALIGALAKVGRQINESRSQSPTLQTSGEWREIVSAVDEKLHAIKPKAAILAAGER